MTSKAASVRGLFHIQPPPDRLAQPLHREFDVLRLQLAPSLDREGSRGIDSLPRKETAPALGELEAVMELADTVPGEVFSCDRDR